MNKAEEYISGLKSAYYSQGASGSWDDFERIKHGVSKEDVNRLKEIFPEIPDSLVSLLEYVDGTYWRSYQGEEIAFYFQGSDLEEYPYYLLSAKQIYDGVDDGFENYGEIVNREFEDEVKVDEKIIDDSTKMNWLHFSDCMNNGGTSQLFIDFSPSDKGIKGQIVRFLHDPDKLQVIANSFDDYLQMLIDHHYDFINQDTIDEIV